MIQVILQLYITYFMFIDQCRGIEFEIFPKPQNELIWYRDGNLSSYFGYVKEINDFLKGNKSKENVQPNKWGPCEPLNFYGFPNGIPCIFISFVASSFGVHKAFNSTNLPREAPVNLRNYIKFLESDKKDTHNKAYITCEGNEPADEENIGYVRIFKSFVTGIENNEFTDSLFAVHFENIERSVVVGIKCTIWASYRDSKEINVVRFGLQID